MAWWGWCILAVYFCGFVVTTRWTAYAMAYEFGTPDGFDIFMSVLLSALMCALVWPLAAAYHLGAFNRDGGFLKEPPRQRRERELISREREAMEREAHIRRMERELGVGQ